MTGCRSGGGRRSRCVSASCSPGRSGRTSRSGGSSPTCRCESSRRTTCRPSRSTGRERPLHPTARASAVLVTIRVPTLPHRDISRSGSSTGPDEQAAPPRTGGAAS